MVHDALARPIDRVVVAGVALAAGGVATIAPWEVAGVGGFVLALAWRARRADAATALVAVTLVVAALLSNVGVAASRFCGAVPAAGFDQPPNRAHAGQYVNAVYGYSVNIPAAFSGYSASGAPERGFGILLSSSPRAFLRVDAAYDSFFDITAPGVHRSDLNAMRQHDSVIEDHAQDIVLAYKPGSRFLTRVRCGDDAHIFIHDDVIVMVNREIYRLDLQSVPERYAADVKALNAMLRSWRWQAIGQSYVK